MSNPYAFKAFLAGVDPSTPLSTLRAFLCQNFEGVTEVKMDQRKRQGFVFVHFQEKKLLEDFLNVKTFIFQGRTLTVKPHLKGKQLVKYKEELLQRRIFIKNLPFNWNDEDLKGFFSSFGKIDSAYIVYNKKTRFSRQFGYVITATKELADYIDRQNNFKVDDRIIYAQKHNNQGKMMSNVIERNNESSLNSYGNYKESSGTSLNKDSCPSSNQTQWAPNRNSEISKMREFMKNYPEFLLFKKFKDRYKNNTQTSHLRQTPNLFLRKSNWIDKCTPHDS